jgi:unsaturated rhamnogalacturonyl hydrolase
MSLQGTGVGKMPPDRRRQAISLPHLVALLSMMGVYFLGAGMVLGADTKKPKGPLPLPEAHWIIGQTAKGTAIPAYLVPGAAVNSPTVLLVGGLNGFQRTSRGIEMETRKYVTRKQRNRPFRLLAIPNANPDAIRMVFPPEGVAYRDNPESHALWRWIATQAPDLVLIESNEDYGLADALAENPVAGVAKVAARDITSSEDVLDSLPQLLAQSEAHKEIDRRVARPPLAVAEELAKVYGQEFTQPIYIQALALIGQIRLGHTAEVQRMAIPFVNGSRDPLAQASSLTLGGHLVFAELARKTPNDPRYVQVVRKAADLGFDERGQMKASMPFHDEMSDSVFMATPLLAEAGRLTGDRKYFDMAARHFDFMQKLDQRADGLWRHSPLTDAAWGRGNAFPALGMALTLSAFPKDHPAYARMVVAFQQHIAALTRFQDADGLWHEVIDKPASYAEYTATAMIGTAIQRGIKNGWLEGKSYRPHVEMAWRSVSARTASDGTLLNVCESTNKQKTVEDYLKRAALFDKDARGGAMGLLFATEMAGLQ